MLLYDWNVCISMPFIYWYYSISFSVQWPRIELTNKAIGAQLTFYQTMGAPLTHANVLLLRLLRSVEWVLCFRAEYILMLIGLVHSIIAARFPLPPGIRRLTLLLSMPSPAHLSRSLSSPAPAAHPPFISPICSHLIPAPCFPKISSGICLKSPQILHDLTSAIFCSSIC